MNDELKNNRDSEKMSEIMLDAAKISLPEKKEIKEINRTGIKN